MVKSQMAKPNGHIHVPFLTQMTVLVGNLGFQSMTDHYETPCTSKCTAPGRPSPALHPAFKKNTRNYAAKKTKQKYSESFPPTKQYVAMLYPRT